jgi:serine phosphatase RsbU (regulator of sigma subunit)
LGVERESSYDQVAFGLGRDDRLVFLSDGVVEARSKSGELYGFSRLASISGEPADLIAMAAQEFGQEDDITVLSVELQPKTAMT